VVILPSLAFYIGGQCQKAIDLELEDKSQRQSVTVSTPVNISGIYKQNPYIADIASVTKDSRSSYFVNPKGELLRSESNGKSVGLVTIQSDISTDFVEYKSFDSDVTESLPFSKGKVLSFMVSPDRKYIAYEIQVGLVGCCMSKPSIPATRIMVMKADGSSKTLIKYGPHGGQIVELDGWLPDSKKIVFHSREVDEAMSHSPYYVANIDGTPNQLFKGIDYGIPVTIDTYSVIGTCADPEFSPLYDAMVYRKGGYEGGDIIISKTNGSEKRVLLTLPENALDSEIRWISDDEVNITYRVFKKFKI
jgi:hypothetical protein